MQILTFTLGFTKQNTLFRKKKSKKIPEWNVEAMRKFGYFVVFGRLFLGNYFIYETLFLKYHYHNERIHFLQKIAYENYS